MAKTRSHKYHKKSSSKKSFFKKLKKTTSKAIPVVTTGLKKVGSAVKNVTMKSKPTIEKGLGAIYKTVMSGFDLGVKGVKNGINMIRSKKTRRH
jgi:hypothetical protein